MVVGGEDCKKRAKLTIPEIKFSCVRVASGIGLVLLLFVRMLLLQLQHIAAVLECKSLANKMIIFINCRNCIWGKTESSEGGYNRAEQSISSACSSAKK